jgi:hypothetical protein
MTGPKWRVAALLLIALLIGETVLTGRGRSKPALQKPKVPAGQTGQNSGAQTRPAVDLPTNRPQETTIRPQTTGRTQSASQPAATGVVAERERLLKLVDEAISKTERRYLHVDEYTPWQIMHGLLALRKDYRLQTKQGTVSAIDFVSSGPMFRGEPWFQKTAHGGRAHPFNIPYHFEGHVNQFPALLCMSGLPTTHQLQTPDGPITIGDIVDNAKMTVNTNEEITWTLWFLTQYIPQNSEWVNQQGQSWSIAKLIQIQVNDPVHDAPCGGTHGLFALAFARNACLSQQGKIRGVWMNAEMKLRQHIELARQLQNADGSFSSNWFRGRGFSADFKERIKTSGHMLEWLMMALPENRLDEVWVRRAIQCVANDLINNANAPAECGPMYHALHALVLYRERVRPASTTPETTTSPLAQSRPTQTPVIVQSPAAVQAPVVTQEPLVAPTPVVIAPPPETTITPSPVVATPSVTPMTPSPAVTTTRPTVEVPPAPLPEAVVNSPTVRPLNSSGPPAVVRIGPSANGTNTAEGRPTNKPELHLRPQASSPNIATISPTAPAQLNTAAPEGEQPTTESTVAETEPASEAETEAVPTPPVEEETPETADNSGSTSPATPRQTPLLILQRPLPGTAEEETTDATAAPVAESGTSTPEVNEEAVPATTVPGQLSRTAPESGAETSDTATETIAPETTETSEVNGADSADHPIAATLVPEIQESGSQEDTTSADSTADADSNTSADGEEEVPQVAEEPAAEGPILK